MAINAMLLIFSRNLRMFMIESILSVAKHLDGRLSNSYYVSNFYQRDAMLARVLAMACVCLSVCLSVRPSVHPSVTGL